MTAAFPARLPDAATEGLKIPGAFESCERFYLPELDVLRFFAFLSVFEWHLTFSVCNYCYTQKGLDLLAKHPYIAHLSGVGMFGVDLFFALSAYLITELLIRERARQGTVNVRWFYARRILRIWPLYFFFLAFSFVLSHYVRDFAASTFYFVSLSLLVGNFALAGWGIPNGIGHLWSVCIEEQFYLLWPQLARRASRRTLVQVGTALIAVSLTSRIAMWMMGASASAFAFNTFSRLDGMAVGILLAAVPRSTLRNFRLLSRAVLVSFGAAAWLSVAYYFYKSPNADVAMYVAILGYSVVALGSAAFIVAALGADNTAGRFMLNAPLTYLGKISYGLYIYHQFAIWLALETCVWGRGSFDRTTLLAYTLLSFALTVALAAASYRFLETPFLNLKRRFTYVPSRPV